MNTQIEKTDSWKQILDGKVNTLLDQISYIKSELAGSEFDESVVEEMCRPYTAMLQEIYQEEYPLAYAIENSDLVVRIEGIGVEKDSPRLSLISSYFGKVRKQVTNIAKALANLEEGGRRLPKQFDLTLSAFAKGSLVLGFSLPTLQDIEEDAGNQPTLFGENDPLYLAAREAMKTLGVVSHFVGENASKEEIAAAIPDAKVRDVALAALNDLVPSGRQGITAVSLAGKEVGNFEQVTLTKQTKEAVRKVLEHPVVSEERVSFHGQVREIDLDAKRLELRHIENLEVNEVRCIYKNYTDDEASEWLNKNVAVIGVVERNANGKARLMEIESIEKTN